MAKSEQVKYKNKSYEKPCLTKSARHEEATNIKYALDEKDYRKLIETTDGLKAVQSYSISRYQTENVEYALALQSFKKKPTKEDYKKIVEEYISNNASKQINISFSQKNSVEDLLNENVEFNGTKAVEVLEEALTGTTNTFFQDGFMNSDEYRNLKEKYNIK